MTHEDIEAIASKSCLESQDFGGKNERPKIRFSLHAASEKETSGSLLRVPTPYPKKLREMAKTARTLNAQPDDLPEPTLTCVMFIF